MKGGREILHTYERPTPYLGFDTKESTIESTRGYYKAKREIIPNLDVCFIDRFESICDEEIEKREMFPPSGRELLRVIKLPEDIYITFFAQPHERCSYGEVLNELEKRLVDLRDEALDGYFPEYIKIIHGEPYISLDYLLNISQRIKNRNTKEGISKIIKIEPEERIFTNVKGRKEKRMLLPSHITTEGKNKVNFVFVDEETYAKAIKDEDYLDKLQLIALEYLRGREFRDSIYYTTCLPFEEEMKRLANERKTSWVEVGDLIFYIPRSVREVPNYGRIYNILFSTSKKEPGEFYILMLDENEYKEVKKKLEEYGAKRKTGITYIPIEGVIKKIRETKEREDLKTRVEQYGEIIPIAFF